MYLKTEEKKKKKKKSLSSYYLKVVFLFLNDLHKQKTANKLPTLNK